ncbi:MAG TPA: hypothetical protein VL993_13050 [Stellaceae bacterium]|nr:hypothetical protein [Stellaceae bacterium]
MPDSFAIMLKSKGTADYKAVGHVLLEAPPRRGDPFVFDLDGRAVRGTVEAIFIPPGCEEACKGTMFVSEA